MSDALDFIGWYNYKSHKQLGIGLNNPENLSNKISIIWILLQIDNIGIKLGQPFLRFGQEFLN